MGLIKSARQCNNFPCSQCRLAPGFVQFPTKATSQSNKGEIVDMCGNVKVPQVHSYIVHYSEEGFIYFYFWIKVLLFYAYQMTIKCHIQTWNKCISNIDTKNKYHFKCNIIFYWTLMVMEYTRYSFLSPMISKENLIEWKVSCLCLFTECLLQSPGSNIGCGKEWVAKCQCECLMVWSVE